MDFAEMKLLLANECATDSLSFPSGFRVSCVPQRHPSAACYSLRDTKKTFVWLGLNALFTY